MIARLVPYPGLAAALFLLWLLLAQSIAPGQLLLAAIVAVTAGWIMVRLRPRYAKGIRWRKALALARIVVLDILRSNLAVAWIAISNRKERTSSFIQLDLELRDEVALTVLALIITATPGTAWVQFDRPTGSLLIHVFDLVNEDEWISLLKSRYEALLMAIFES